MISTLTNVRLDTASSKANDNNCSDIATESSAVLDRNRQGGRPEDHKALGRVSAVVEGEKSGKYPSEYLRPSR